MEAQSTFGCADSGHPKRLARREREGKSAPSFADTTKLDNLRLSLSASYHRLARHDTPTKTCT